MHPSTSCERWITLGQTLCNSCYLNCRWITLGQTLLNSCYLNCCEHTLTLTCGDSRQRDLTSNLPLQFKPPRQSLYSSFRTPFFLFFHTCKMLFHNLCIFSCIFFYCGEIYILSLVHCCQHALLKVRRYLLS